MMILLFKDMINLINLGMPMTNSEVTGPPHERRGGGLINLNNRKRFLKQEEHGAPRTVIIWERIEKTVCAVFLSVTQGREAAGNVAVMDCVSPDDG